MLGLNLEIGALYARPRVGSSGAGSEPNVPPRLTPVGWDGTASSGFASTPSDPVRITAKPILRLITAPLKTFADTDFVGAIAVANSGETLIGGIDRVRFHFEGGTLDVLSPSFRTFTRPDGSTYSQYGYWAELAKPEGIEGEALLYVEAIPADATMQNRVIGPFKYLLYDAEFTDERVVDPNASEIAGQRYTSLRRALNNLRSVSAKRSRVTISAPSLTLEQTNPVKYDGQQSCVVEANQPCTISRTEGAKGEWRPNHSGMILRGSNLTFDTRYIARIRGQNGQHPMIFDQVAFTNSGGRYELWDKGQRPAAHLFESTNQGGVWLTECSFDNTSDSAMQAVNLVRGCTFNTVVRDLFNKAGCVLNTRAQDFDADEFRAEIDAMTVDGPPGASLSLDGVSDGSERTFTAKVGGSVISTFVVGRTSPYLNGNQFDVSDVVDWINTLPNWNAILVDDTRRATALSEAGSSGGSFTDIDVSSSANLVTQFDVHPDWWQGTGPTENVLAMDNWGVDLNCQLINMNLYDYKDFAFINNAWDQKDPGRYFSNFVAPTSHGLFVHNTCPDQSWRLRTSGGAVEFRGDAYCLFANNVLLDGDYDGGPSTGEVTKNNHYLTGATTFGDIGASVAGTRDDLFADIDNGDFNPAGALLTYLKPPVFAYDSIATGDQPVGRLPQPI